METASRQCGGVVSFVVPYYDDGRPWRRQALASTLESIRAQSDSAWRVHLVDDASPAPGTAGFLRDQAERMDGRMTVLRAWCNAGAGAARNLAVQAARGDGCTLLSYLDADDLAHRDRVAVVRARFDADPDLDFLYSDIELIDETGALWRSADLLPGVRRMSREQQLAKLCGREHWITHATDRDCVAVASAMNLRIGPPLPPGAVV
jgi:glycosyltransferase involved in cell wall biosynthesis